MQQYVFTRVHAPRKFPDPNYPGVEVLTALCNVTGIPHGLPSDPNARQPKISRRIYKDVMESLMSGDGRFHQRHKGVTIVAEKVTKRSEDELVVHIDSGQGILDGGHSVALIESTGDLPDNQFVKVEFLTGVRPEWIPDISGGLNTSMQVQPMSLDNLAGRFDWIKEELADEPYAERVAWREGEDGEVDARDLVAILTCFNIDLFPNGTGTEEVSHPVMAYEKKSLALELFEQHAESFERLRPILKDILILHDTIRIESRGPWNKGKGETKGRFGNLAFVQTRERGEFVMAFTGKKATQRLHQGALMPMLAAFRWMVEPNEATGQVQWRGGFDKVLERWHQCAYELMRMTHQANQDLGRNPQAVGKNRSHWSNLHRTVAMFDLMDRYGIKS